MSERPTRPLEEEAAKAADDVEVPEYWEAKKPPSIDRKVFEYQLAVAHEIAKKTGEPLVKVLQKYTSALRTDDRQDPEGPVHLKGLDDEKLIDTVYEKYLADHADDKPVPYHEGKGFGCFAYDYNEADHAVNIHFANSEFEEDGPLSKSKVDRRLRELKDLFTDVKRKFPDVKCVRGASWLYNLESYRRLFPPSYTADQQLDSKVKRWQTGGVWGQFMDSDSKLKEDVAESFLQKVKDVPVGALLAALPMPPQRVEGPIEDFYTLYGIALAHK